MKKPTKSKLGNPVVATYAGAKVVEQTASVIPFLIKTAVIGGLIYWGYSTYTNRFKKVSELSSEPQANISYAQAQIRADSIYASINLFSNDFDNVAKQLTGLNYNGLVRVYNAFGHHTGTLLKGELTLVEWLKDQFNDYQMAQLSFLTGGKFFQ
jgi:hypothetical protein